MPDITMCCNEKCNQKTDCYRFMAVSSERQAFAKFEPDEDGFCDEKKKIQPWHKTKKFYEDKDTK